MNSEMLVNRESGEILEWNSETDGIHPAENVSQRNKGTYYEQGDRESQQPDVFNEFNIAVVDYHIDHNNVITNIFNETQELGDERERRQIKKLRCRRVVNSTWLVILSVCLTYSAMVVILWLMGFAYNYLSTLLGVR